jgi:hypothetical protein
VRLAWSCPVVFLWFFWGAGGVVLGLGGACWPELAGGPLLYFYSLCNEGSFICFKIKK